MSTLSNMSRVNRAMRTLHPEGRTSRRFRWMFDSNRADAVSPTDEPYFLRGMDRVYDGASSADLVETQNTFRRFMHGLVGHGKDREVLYFIGKLADDEAIPRQRWITAFEPGKDIREETANILAQYVTDPKDYEALLRRVSPKMRQRIEVHRIKKDFVDQRFEAFDPDLPNSRLPQDPDFGDGLPMGSTPEDFGFGSEQGMTLGRAAWVKYGLRGYGHPDRIQVTREILMPHPEASKLDHWGNEMVFGSTEGWATWNPPRNALIDWETQPFSQLYRDAFGGRWHAAHAGAHRHGFSSLWRNLFAVDPRINVSFMARWEAYVDYYKLRYGAVYVKIEATDVKMVTSTINGEELPVVKALRYQIFVPDKVTGQPIRVLDRSIDASWRPGFTQKQMDGYFAEQFKQSDLLLLEANRKYLKWLNGEDHEAPL